MVSNHQVTIDGDTASGRCYLQAQHVTRAAGRDHNYIVAGTYVDRYKRTDAGWRIAWRNLRVTWTEGSPGAGDTPTSETAFVIAGWIDVDPAGVEALLEAAVPMMTASLAEPGCQDYVFSADPATPGRIRIYEQWRSEADLRGHFETPHMEVFRQALEGAGVRDRNMSRYHVTHVGPVMEARSL
jgi:quinol monooxygenase YgiN